MSEDLIESLWERAGEGRQLGREELARALRPRLVRGTRVIRGYLWMFLAALLVTLVLGGVNIAGYWENPVWRPIQIGLTLLAAALACFEIRLLGDPRLVDRPEDSLLDSVRRRLGLFGAPLERWMWAATFSMVLLTLALGTWIDNQDGTYRINKPLVFFGTQLAMVAIVYGSLKWSFYPLVRELRATLQDLENQLLERTVEVERWKRRWRSWQIVLMVLMTAFLLLGIWAAFQLMP